LGRSLGHPRPKAPKELDILSTCIDFSEQRHTNGPQALQSGSFHSTFTTCWTGVPRERHTASLSTTTSTSLGSTAKRTCEARMVVALNQTCPRPKTWAQYAFKNSMIHGVLQFALRIAFRCALHRSRSQDIHRRELYKILPVFYELVLAGGMRK
jgi:hypothetical protein